MQRTLLFVAIMTTFLSIFTNAIEVSDIRTYSGSNKTRITVELNDRTNYATHFDASNVIYIYLPGIRNKSSSSSININDSLVESLLLHEEAGGLEVKIPLKGRLPFAIFSLDSPYRVVVDVARTLDVLKSERQFDNQENIKEDLVQTLKVDEQVIKTVEMPDSIESSSEDGLKEKLFKIVNSESNITLFQLIFDLGVIIGFVVLGKMHKSPKKVNEQLNEDQVLKKKSLKKDQSFSDMMEELERKVVQPDKEDKTKVDDLSVPKEYEKVYELSKRGLDRLTISQKSNVPIGEVNLILDLMQSKGRS